MKMLALFALITSWSAHSHMVRQYPDAPLEIITIGHPTLRMQATEVDIAEIETESFQNFIDDMMETMKKAGGVGLAAPQVNVSKRMFVMKPSMLKAAEVIINPIVEYLEERGTKNSTEGCLSIPGKSFTVERYKQLNLSYLNREGEQQIERARGFRAIVIQHEYDHLNGTMISDFFIDMFDAENDFEFVYPLM